MESVRVTLAVGHMKPDLSIFCYQARPQIVELWHQPRHKTYSLSCLVCVLGQAPSKVPIKETREALSSNWQKCWVPQPNMRWRMGSPAQGEGSEGSVTSQDHHPQNQPTGTLGDSKRSETLLGSPAQGEESEGSAIRQDHHPQNQSTGTLGDSKRSGTLRELPWVLCVYIMKELLSILLGLQTVRVWTVSDSFACCGTLFLH